MKICVYLHMAVPVHQAGSETTIHGAMRAMVERGHNVTVIADRLMPENITAMAERGLESFKVLSPMSYEFEGVKVTALPQNQFHHATVREIAKDADLLITHLDCTSLAMTLAVDLKKPLAHFIHNHAQLGYWKVPPHKAQLVIFNTHWIAMNETYKDQPWPGESIVIHPIIEPEKYRCERGNKITLCNPTDGKGIDTLHRLAEAMPDYEFLVVEGIYGEQVAPPHLPDEWVAAHPNIEHMKNSPDFRDVLRKTRVLLMPSNYESYGRCAVEAACAGIPSIVHPTQGLWEALGDGRRYPAVESKYGVNGSVVFAQETLPDGLFDDGLVNGAGIFCLRIDSVGNDEFTEAREGINASRLNTWKAQIERLFKDEVYYRSRVDAALKLAASFDPAKEFDRLENAFIKTVSDWNQEVKAVAMWVSDKRIWETSDGKLVAEQNGRIPQDAVKLAAGIGTELPEDVARLHGFLPSLETAKEIVEGEPESTLLNSKSLQPDEDKAIHAPAEDKARKTRKKKVA